ncbi:Thi73p [Sugiyamaella lignohabitans]|uniref:Thi73p n=1 Tax=Sugiyamaella lignohabitans TaxID=796027 RepID=A0A161HIH7_9ASCO|nr:Thi73p [Sugiyamaella lignohabitans]ANB10948.1 Thi73p [Sugiyamaella lignohabitans]
MWYKKAEQGKRIGAFYVMNSVTLIAAGIISYAASFAKTAFASWRIFLLCMGLVTVFCGICVFLFLPDSIVRSKGFTDEEKVAALLRVKDEQSGTQNSKLKRYQMVEAVSDPKVWFVVLSVFLFSIPNGAITVFNSIIINSYGFGSQETLIVGAPAGVVTGAAVIIIQYYSDKTQNRTLISIWYFIPSIVGLAIMIALGDREKTLSMKAGLLIASYLSQVFGGGLALFLSWNASNIAGHSKKALVNALTFIAFPLGNILGTQTFQNKDAPMYIPGKISIMACLCAQVVVSTVWFFVNKYYNKKKQTFLDTLNVYEYEGLRMKMEFSDETDMRNPFFKYTK